MAVEIGGSARRRGPKRLRAAAQAVLEALGRADSELSVVLVDDREMRRLNRRHRGVDRATDVLSFSQLEGEELAAGGGAHLGDVVISVDTARRQARAGGWTYAEETFRLLVHGVLHLLGYDHERGPAEARRMARRERSVAASLRRRGFPCAGEAR